MAGQVMRMEREGWRLAALTTLVLIGVEVVERRWWITGGALTLWPGTALLVGLLISTERRPTAFRAILAGAAFAPLILITFRLPAAELLLDLANNLLVTVTAFALLQRTPVSRDLFLRPSGVTALMATAAVVALLPAAIAAIAAPAAIRGAAMLQAYAHNLLGMLVVTPTLLIAASAANAGTTRLPARRTVAGLALSLAAVGAVAALVFQQAALPLAFLIIPFVLLATFRLRVLGAASAVALVALISISATAAGRGPFALPMLPLADRMLLVQLFLACCFLCALPVAAVLTERDRCAAATNALAERYRAVVDNVADVIFQLDLAGRWTYLNPAWERLTAHPVAATLGGDWLDSLAAADRDFAAGWIAPVLAGTLETATYQARLATPGGSRWVELAIRPLRDSDGAPAGVTGLLRDVDDARRREQQAAVARDHAEQRAKEAALLASTDELTGLANRRAFMRQLDREIAASVEFGWPLSVAMFDVDHFKRVNDTHGHAVGDEVLKRIAERAGTVVRGADLVGRLGGEEFAILMPGATAADASHVAERLRKAIEAPHARGLNLPTVTVSVGLAERIERRSGERLLAIADRALYRAKEEGRNRVRISA